MQTLGEEYTGLVMVRAGAGAVVPGRGRRAAWLLLHVLGPLLHARLRQWAGGRGRGGGAGAGLAWVLEGVELVARLHVCLFYFQGTFYQLAKRLTNITYVKHAGAGGSSASSTRCCAN